jgi:hypothetical protein
MSQVLKCVHYIEKEKKKHAMIKNSWTVTKKNACYD